MYENPCIFHLLQNNNIYFYKNLKKSKLGLLILPTNNRSVSVGNVGNCFRAQNHVQWH